MLCETERSAGSQLRINTLLSHCDLRNRAREKWRSQSGQSSEGRLLAQIKDGIRGGDPLQIGTGNLFQPKRELNRAIREIILLIREPRHFTPTTSGKAKCPSLRGRWPASGSRGESLSPGGTLLVMTEGCWTLELGALLTPMSRSPSQDMEAAT